MTYVAVNDLKRPRELRATLEREREVVVTKDGKPFAVMVGVDPERADDVLREIRRARFSVSVAEVRRKAQSLRMTDAEIGAEVKLSRKGRASR